MHSSSWLWGSSTSLATSDHSVPYNDVLCSRNSFWFEHHSILPKSSWSLYTIHLSCRIFDRMWQVRMKPQCQLISLFLKQPIIFPMIVNCLVSSTSRLAYSTFSKFWFMSSFTKNPSRSGITFLKIFHEQTWSLTIIWMIVLKHILTDINLIRGWYTTGNQNVIKKEINQQIVILVVAD